MVIEKHNLLKNSENENLFGFNFIENNLDKAITEDSDRVLIERILDLLQDAKAEEIVLIDTTKLDVEFHDNGEIKLLGFLNGEGKKDVTLERIKLKYYYDGKPNQRGNIKYKLEVKLENNKVVGWRDL